MPTLLTTALVALLATIAAPQDDGILKDKKPVTTKLTAPKAAVPAGTQTLVNVEFAIEDHWHIYSPEPQDASLPTVITPKFPDGFAAGDFVWPQAKTIDSFGTMLRGYEGNISVEIPIRIARDVKPGKYPIELDITFQACKNVCLDGKDTLSSTIEVSAAGQIGTESNVTESKAVKTASEPAAGKLIKSPPASIDGEYPMRIKMDCSKSALAPGEVAEITLQFSIDAGWHTYSPNNNPRGGVALEFFADGWTLEGDFTAPEPKSVFDKNLNVTNLEYEGDFVIKQKVRAPDTGIGAKKPTFRVTGLTCNPATCKPPATWTAEFDIKALAGPANGTVITKPRPPSKVASVEDPNKSKSTEEMSLSEFLIWACVGGWASLFTPCVFPMIPITVSFFSKRSKGNRRKAVGMATTYTAGIILTFTLIGVLASVAFGASGLTNFATNFWVNLALGSLFVVLAFSLLGLFTITAPAGLTDKIENAKSQTSNDYTMTLLMAIAFTLASFTCTVPVLGGLLGLSAQGEIGRPALGMLAYSGTFAAPFFLLALFPTVLQKLPKGGAWLEVMKISMGFVEFAAALKFLSNADIALNAQILTRPVFLAIWIALFLALALYLFGILKMPGAEGEVGPIRAIFGVSVLALTIYLFTGLFGATYSQFTEGFLPPPNYGPASSMAINGSNHTKQDLVKWYLDFDEGIAAAKKEKKRIFINFTGDNCSICRGVENVILPDPEVQAELKKFICVELFLDREYTPELAKRSARYREYQERKFRTAARPYFAVVESDGETIVAKYPTSTDAAPSKESIIKLLKEGQK
ncbi:MAG: protein-disulfide reductase DsbD domain-containing protein [Planctomycetota bacterium]